MPTYAYHCDACNHDWDERRALGDHATTCPECGGDGRHVFSPVRFKFALGKRWQRREHAGKVYSRTYAPGETVGDPMLDEGFERVE